MYNQNPNQYNSPNRQFNNNIQQNPNNLNLNQQYNPNMQNNQQQYNQNYNQQQYTPNYNQQQNSNTQWDSNNSRNINQVYPQSGNNYGQQVIPNMNINQIQQPIFKEIAVGQGINQNEYKSIVNSCTQVYLKNEVPLSVNCGKAVKQALGCSWFVICGSSVEKDYDFSVTSVEEADFMAFTLDSTLFQVVKTGK